MFDAIDPATLEGIKTVLVNIWALGVLGTIAVVFWNSVF